MFHLLRSKRSIRRPRGKKRSHGRGQIRNMVSIRERPTEADTRQVGGHWEADLVFGARPSAVATLVDRATRYAMVVALPDGNKADPVARALIEHMGRLPTHLRRSLTWDRGSEMAPHAAITTALSMPVFFCDPHHPWQRGTNENTNRLLRQYLHRNADLATFTQDELNAVAAKLNHRPRRVLDWATPAEAFGAAEPKPMLRTPAYPVRFLGCDHDLVAAGGLPRARRRPRPTLVRRPGPRARLRRDPRRMRRRPKTSHHLRMPTADWQDPHRQPTSHRRRWPRLPPATLV